MLPDMKLDETEVPHRVFGDVEIRVLIAKVAAQLDRSRVPQLTLSSTITCMASSACYHHALILKGQTASVETIVHARLPMRTRNQPWSAPRGA